MKEYNFYRDNSISYRKFLSVFYGISGEGIYKSKFTHNDMKEIFGFLERASYDEVLDNPSLVLTGRIAIVSDYNGSYVPYRIPINEIEKNIEENEHIDEYIIVYENAIKRKYQDIMYNPDTKLYELKILAHQLKQIGEYKERKRVCKTIKEKTDPKIKRYKMEKAKLCMEGNDYYD